MKTVSGGGRGLVLAAVALAATGLCIYSLYGIASIGIDVFPGNFAKGVAGIVAAGVVAGPVTSYFAARDAVSGSAYSSSEE